MNKESIIKRCAVRKYRMYGFDEETFKNINMMINDCQPLTKDIKFRFDLIKDGIGFSKLLGGIIGSYGKVLAPHYIVASCNLCDDAYENIGYVGERIVLNLTDMNIGTCWIGGGIKQTLFSDYLHLEDGLIPVAVIAIGYPEKDNVFRNKNTDFKRKNMEQITNGDYKQSEDIMELVRLAPSAMNLQPWRYDFIKENQIDVYRIKPNFILKHYVNEMNRIDLGISLCHFEIGLIESNKKMRLVDLKREKDKIIYYKSIFIE